GGIERLGPGPRGRAAGRAGIGRGRRRRPMEEEMLPVILMVLGSCGTGLAPVPDPPTTTTAATSADRANPAPMRFEWSRIGPDPLAGTPETGPRVECTMRIQRADPGLDAAMTQRRERRVDRAMVVGSRCSAPESHATTKREPEPR